MTAPDIARTIAALAARTRSSIVFTIAPRTFALSVMHAAGRLFPRGQPRAGDSADFAPRDRTPARDAARAEELANRSGEPCR